MDGGEGAGILDPQSRQRIDVEKAPVVDVAGSEPPMPEPVMLALQQVMQRERLRRAVGSGPKGVEPARDDLGASGDAFQFRLEGRRFLAIGMAQAFVARRQIENTLSRRAVFRPGFLDDVAQDLAVTFRCDRQAMLEIPGRKAAFVCIVAQLDLALFQRLAIG